jgi:beta-galactosidase
MNKLRLLTPILLIALLLLSCTNKTDSRLTLNFNADWQFYKSVDTAAMPSTQAEWETVILPHTANIEPLTVNNQWQGICYYIKRFYPRPAMEEQNPGFAV